MLSHMNANTCLLSYLLKCRHEIPLTLPDSFDSLTVLELDLQLLKNPSVVGPFEAAVVHADNSAVDFFKKNGFSDDVILNKRWR